jgi:glycosyltransferase involved in cell wall biosynthesis
MNHERFTDLYASDWGQSLRRRYREHLGRATRIIAISRTTKEDVTRFYGIEAARIDVAQPAVDVGTFYPDADHRPVVERAASIGPGAPYFLYVGGRWTYKNFRGMLEGFARSRVRESHFLLVAGAPWLPEEQRLVDDVGLADRVRLVRQPSVDVLRALYSSATAFVFPSYHEGFGIPLLEAMACGTMVLTSDADVFHEVAADAAVFFDPFDRDALAGALETPLDPARRQRYVTRGYARIRQYSWDHCAEQFYGCCRTALLDPGRDRPGS